MDYPLFFIKQYFLHLTQYIYFDSIDSAVIDEPGKIISVLMLLYYIPNNFITMCAGI